MFDQQPMVIYAQGKERLKLQLENSSNFPSITILDPQMNFPTDPQPFVIVQAPFKAPGSNIFLEPNTPAEPLNVYRLARTLDDDDPIAVYSLKKDGAANKELKKVLIDPKTGIILTEIQVIKCFFSQLSVFDKILKILER